MSVFIFACISVLLFVLGAAVGSFLNVVMQRTLDEESWVWGRSRCDHCRTPIAWYDLVPLLSFVWLRGACRQCHKPIALSHPVTELLVGSLFVWWYWGGSLFFLLTHQPFQVLQPLFWLIVGVVMIYILVADTLYMLIPDIAVGTLLVLTVVYRLALVLSGVMQFSDLLATVAVTALTTALLGGIWLITSGRGMGLGDVKFMVPLGLLLGWPKAVVGIFLAFVMGAMVGVLLLVVGTKKVGQVIPFGPFMIVGALCALVWGDSLLQWYIQLL